MWRVVFFVVVVLALGGSVWLTYERIFVDKDYILEYSVACDPTLEACFILACEEGEPDCEDYYFSTVKKGAADIARACGDALEDCESASICLSDDSFCEITLCNPEVDECIFTPVIEEAPAELEPAEEE